MYYAENPDSAHDIHELKVTLLGQSFTFLTDSGVFLKNGRLWESSPFKYLDFEKGKTLLDLGCGYGPLGISLAKVQGVKPTMVDINNRAIDLAKQNAQKNGVEADIFQSNIYEKVNGTFDYIISNPPIRAGKQVVHTIISESINYLKVDGNLTIVIQKKQGAPSAKAKMEEVFGNVEILKRDKGYYILRSEKTK